MVTGAVNLYFQQEDNTSDSLNNRPRSGLEGDGSCFDAPENPPSKKKVSLMYVYVWC